MVSAHHRFLGTTHLYTFQEQELRSMKAIEELVGDRDPGRGRYSPSTEHRSTGLMRDHDRSISHQGWATSPDLVAAS